VPDDPELNMALNVWDLMDSRIDWVAMPIIVEIEGIQDPELLIVQLKAIRDQRQDDA